MTLTEPSTRTTRAFCVGHAKSGTASLCGLLSGNYHSAHEPERAELLDMILQESRDEVGQVAFQSYLVERDLRLNLEFDIAWANQFILGHPLMPRCL